VLPLPVSIEEKEQLRSSAAALQAWIKKLEL
jgi:hypothetical protein